MSPNLRYSEDELREQWAFIDSLVDSQAAALRSGAQDPEDEPVEAAPNADLLRELDGLRARVRRLEAERAQLLERLRLADVPAAAARTPLPRAAPPPRELPPPRLGRAAPPTAQRRVESRVRNWWRRISR